MPNLCGNIPDWDAIREIADRHDLAVVEDSCDVLDSWLGGTRTGTRSDISVTSFARTHAITAAGNGGMVGVNDDALLDECVTLRRWGRRSEPFLFGSERGREERFGTLADGTPYDLIFVFDSLGYNFEPSEIGAAYGLVQLDKLDEFNGQRRDNWQRLHDYFEHREGEGVAQGVTQPDSLTTWMRFCFTIPDDAPMSRNDVQAFLEARGVSTRMVWTGNILRQPGFAADRAPGTGDRPAGVRPADGQGAVAAGVPRPRRRPHGVHLQPARRPLHRAEPLTLSAVRRRAVSVPWPSSRHRPG